MPGRVEVRDLHDTAQVSGPIGVTAWLAVPVDAAQCTGSLFLMPGVVGIRDGLHEPSLLPLAVEALKGDGVAADLSHQLSQQGQRQPFAVRQVGTVLADDARQGAQVPFADRHRSCHDTPRPRYSGRAVLAIRRTSDGSNGTDPPHWCLKEAA